MGTGIYSIVAGLCLSLTFVLYLRMIGSVARSEKRDIYVGIMTIGMIYLGLDVLWGIIYDSLLMIILIHILELNWCINYSISQRCQWHCWYRCHKQWYCQIIIFHFIFVHVTYKRFHFFPLLSVLFWLQVIKYTMKNWYNN